MTTEDDFQRALDANPDDWQTRLVFADFLDEHGDKRAEGYRALGRLRLCPNNMENTSWWYQAGSFYAHERPPESFLPGDWFANLEFNGWQGGAEFTVGKRRQLEDAAAIAFAKLSVERRTELLNAELVGA